ncbi:PQQ-binding-like beta-propeller repeat protein [Actinosynnema sp. NPDC059797]
MVGVVLAVVGAVCAGVSAAVGGGVPREAAAWEVAGVAGVVLAALPAVLGTRFRTPVAALAAAFAAYLLVDDTRSGIADPSSALLLVGAAAVLVGAAVRREPWPRPVAAAAVAVVLAAGFGAVVGHRALVVRGGTAGAVRPAAVADRPVGQPWRWTAPASVEFAVVAGAGLVVGTGDGELVALGPDGGPRWRYARPFASLAALSAAPDGALVVAAFRGGGSHDRTGVLGVLLDAVTGEVLREWATPWPGEPTSNALVVPEPRDHRVRAEDPRTGGHLWTWTAPDGCATPHEPEVGADVVLVGLVCPGSAAVVALDDRDGAERWRHRVSPEAVTGPRVAVLPGGSGVAVTAIGSPAAVLRTRDGEPVVESPRRYDPSDAGPVALSWEEAGDRWRVTGVDPGSGAVHPPVELPCGGRVPAATTRSTLVWLCPAPGGAELMWQGWGASTADRRALAGWGPATDHRVDVLPAPGFLALVGRDDRVVVGYPAG